MLTAATSCLFAHGYDYVRRLAARQSRQTDNPSARQLVKKDAIYIDASLLSRSIARGASRDEGNHLGIVRMWRHWRGFEPRTRLPWMFLAPRIRLETYVHVRMCVGMCCTVGSMLIQSSLICYLTKQSKPQFNRRQPVNVVNVVS